MDNQMNNQEALKGLQGVLDDVKSRIELTKMLGGLAESTGGNLHKEVSELKSILIDQLYGMLQAVVDQIKADLEKAATV